MSNNLKKKPVGRTLIENKIAENSTVTLDKTFDFINFFGTFLGLRFCYEWKNNGRFLFIMIGFAFFWSQIFYTQFKYIADGEQKKILEVFAVYGILLSCMLKIRCFVNYFKEVTALHNFTYKIIRQAPRDAIAEQIEKYQRKNLKIYKLIAAIELGTVVVCMYYPIKSFIFDNKMVSVIPLQLMFIDQTKLTQFLVANFYAGVTGVFSVFGSLLLALNFYALILNYSIQVDLIEYDICQLDTLWSYYTKNKLSDRYLLLRNICRKCQDSANYIREIKKIFDVYLYLYFAAVYMSQIICLYEVEMENWVQGIGIALGMFVEMLLHCLLGTKITITNERLCFILTQSKWYTYDVSSQKIFLSLLRCRMNSKELWIGPLAPLSIVSGVQIVKSIYTYYAFLTKAV